MTKHFFIRSLRNSGFILVLAFLACKKSKPEATLTAPVLMLPAKDAPCYTGVAVSDAKSNITFQWSSSANAARYEIVIRNLLNNGLVSKETTQTSVELTLDRSAAYSWVVNAISVDGNKRASSDSWKFYNPGPGQISFLPYPADLISPKLSSVVSGATQVELKWEGDDPDKDIASYTVFFGDKPEPPLLKAGVKDKAMVVPVVAGKTYFWKIATYDSAGNVAESAVSDFSVR